MFQNISTKQNQFMDYKKHHYGAFIYNQYCAFVLFIYFVNPACVHHIFSIITSDICQENANAVVHGSLQIQLVSHIKDEIHELVLQAYIQSKNQYNVPLSNIAQT